MKRVGHRVGGWPRLLVAGAALLLTAPGFAQGDQKVAVAAAANFVYAVAALNAEFSRVAPGVKLTTTTAASGSLFAQIKNGAPFDVLLSADTDYPQQVVKAGLGAADTLRTFATGRLVLWVTRPGLDVADVAGVLRASATKTIAIARPKTAPYGRAAQAVLEKLGVWREAQGKLVFGDSITQTAQFVQTGNADAGFVALSLVRSPQLSRQGRWHEIPADWHASVPLDHGVVLTTRGTVNPAARRYLDFLGSDAAKTILRDYGYGVPR